MTQDDFDKRMRAIEEFERRARNEHSLSTAILAVLIGAGLIIVVVATLRTMFP